MEIKDNLKNRDDLKVKDDIKNDVSLKKNKVKKNQFLKTLNRIYDWKPQTAGPNHVK